MYAVTVDEAFGMSRDALAQYLFAQGVETRTFFCPMNMQPFLRAQTGFREIACPVAERLWETGLYLPSACSLTEAAIASIADLIRRAPLAQ